MPSPSGRHLLSGVEPALRGEPQIADSVECRDQFGRAPRYLRISVTGRCNFRCLYCAPESDEPGRPKADALTDGEILRLVGLFVRAGVRKVRFTGGEPLLRHGLPALMKSVQALEGIQEICISTNAYLLEEHLDALVDAGLATVNISCDTMREDRFERITRRQGAARVQSAIAAALAHPQIQRVKINMVVMRGINDDEIPAFAGLCDNPKIDVRFIEFMPTAEVAYLRDMLVPEDEVRARIGTPLVPVALADPSAPARLWSIPGLSGRIGFISTMTHKFCARCDRIRVTADGRIANCLFAESLLDLKALLRSGAADAEILAAVVAYWSGKAAGHRLDDPDFLGRPTMIAVGG
ncbi:MAG: GTP 3',8-cyclase MoaA [candidate division Zixibacteria bacterium]|nr:GTP 3',8-cyclase MoaA [candidate division Zixibacteria bacterium]